jgi:hypothetical protein
MFKLYRSKILVALAIFILINTISLPKSLADSPTIIHTPPQAIPAVGEMMDILVQLDKTKTFDNKLLGSFIIDGKISEIILPFATLDNYERPTYSFKIVAPFRSLSYFFRLQTNDKPVTSERYYLVRDCKANLDPDVSTEKIDELPVSELSDKADNLERQREAYNQSIKLLNEIDELLKEVVK